jgi:hypothetical protein
LKDKLVLKNPEETQQKHSQAIVTCEMRSWLFLKRPVELLPLTGVFLAKGSGLQILTAQRACDGCNKQQR